MSQQPGLDWTDQSYYQPASQQPDRSYQYYQQPCMYPGSNSQPTAKYMQPFYGTPGLAPIIAELPAPLPPAPATTTSTQQLTEDERLARKLSAPDQQLTDDEELARQLQQLEVQEARSRSNSNVSQRRRPVSVALPNPQHTMPPLSQQRSAQSLRPHSHSITNASTQYSPSLAQPQSVRSLRPHSQSLSSEVPWSPGSFGPPPQTQSRYSLLPEVVPGLPIEAPSSRLLAAAMNSLPEVLSTNLPEIVDPLSDPGFLAAYLEEHSQVPYPPQWRLKPIVKMYHAQTTITPKISWLDTPESSAWMTHRRSEYSSHPAPASYTFAFKTKGGSYRDPRFSWMMHCNEQVTKTKKRQLAWTYDLRLDLNSGVRKTEALRKTDEKTYILTTYVHAPNYDSLRFIGNDGKAYLWVSHMPLSSVNGSRYDIVRHALFVAAGNIPDPLFGDIVADHTYWDGFVDETEIHEAITCNECQIKPIVGQRWKCKTCPIHNTCGLCRSSGANQSSRSTCRLALTCVPDETLCIRSATVDPALVIASLQVLKDWQKHELRQQKAKDPQAFMQSEEAARGNELGRLAYWKGSDLGEKSAALQRARSRAENAEAMVNPNEITSALGNLADAGLAMAAHGSGQHSASP